MLIFLHFCSHDLHLFQAGGDEPRQTNDVGALDFGARQNVVTRHHHAHVDHFEVVALQHHGDDVFANVVHIALHRGHDDLALAAHIGPSGRQGLLFCFDVGHQMRHSLLHDTRTFHHLGQKHLALTKAVTHDVHAIHQRAFDHFQCASPSGHHGLIGRLGVFGDEVGDAMHQGMGQAFIHRRGGFGRATPSQLLAHVFAGALGLLGNFQQALGSIVPAIEHHVFHPLAQLGLEFVVHANHAGIHNAHVHARTNGVIQKHGVNGFTNRVVAPE